MAEHEIGIQNKICGIYANLQDIKRLLKESKGHLNKKHINNEIRGHVDENLKFVQELNRQGVTNDDIERRLQEVPILMHNGNSMKRSASRGLPSKMNTTRPTQNWRRIIEFVPPKDEASVAFQLPENRPHMALLEGPRE